MDYAIATVFSCGKSEALETKGASTPPGMRKTTK